MDADGDDRLRAALARAVPTLDDPEAWAAVRHRVDAVRSRRRAAVAVVGAAALIAAVAAVSVADRDRPGRRERVVAGADPTLAPTTSWPWVTSTTAPPRQHDQREIERITNELSTMPGRSGDPRWRSSGITRVDANGDFDAKGRWVVAVALRADGASLAGELWRQWGDVLEITVGARRYPTGEPAGTPECPGPSVRSQPGESETVQPALLAELTLDSSEIPSGADVAGTITITNPGDNRVEAMTGAVAVGVVVRPGTGEVVGVWDGALTAEARLIDLAPGESQHLPVVGGTATCSTEGPPGLAPGAYELVVAVGDDGGLPPLARAKVPITVTEPQ